MQVNMPLQLSLVMSLQLNNKPLHPGVLQTPPTHPSQIGPELSNEQTSVCREPRTRDSGYKYRSPAGLHAAARRSPVTAWPPRATAALFNFQMTPQSFG